MFTEGQTLWRIVYGEIRQCTVVKATAAQIKIRDAKTNHCSGMEWTLRGGQMHGLHKSKHSAYLAFLKARQDDIASHRKTICDIELLISQTKTLMKIEGLEACA